MNKKKFFQLVLKDLNNKVFILKQKLKKVLFSHTFYKFIFQYFKIYRKLLSVFKSQAY